MVAALSQNPRLNKKLIPEQSQVDVFCQQDRTATSVFNMVMSPSSTSLSSPSSSIIVLSLAFAAGSRSSDRMYATLVFVDGPWTS